MLYLFMDQEGTIFTEEAGEAREVGALGTWTWDEPIRQYTDAEVIATAVAEATDDEAGEVCVKYITASRDVYRGQFTQGREGVTLDPIPEIE